VNWPITAENVVQFSTVIDQFAYCLHLTALHFCLCHGLNTVNVNAVVTRI